MRIYIIPPEKHRSILYEKILWWAGVVLWAALIFVLSSQSQLPGPEVDWLDYFFKKAAHMSVYAVLFIFLVGSISRTQVKLTIHQKILLAAALTIVYAMSDEWHQSYVPHRGPSLRDVGYDSLGVAVVYLKLYRYI